MSFTLAALSLLLPVAGVPAAESAPPSSLSPPASIVGAWEVCGGPRKSVHLTEPAGVPNFKWIFGADGLARSLLPQATTFENTVPNRYRYVDGVIEAFHENGTKVEGTVGSRSDGRLLVSWKTGRFMLLCPLGGVDSAAVPLQPQSVDYVKTWSNEEEAIVVNPVARVPPSRSLLGTWELVRVFVKIPRATWLGSNQYGAGSARMAFEDTRVCLRMVDMRLGELGPACADAKVSGLRVEPGKRVGDDGRPDTDWLTAFETGDIEVSKAGTLIVKRDFHDEEWIWIGPGNLTDAPLEGRVSLAEFIPGDD